MPEVAVQRARVVRAEVGYTHPTELEIEVLAHIRRALVRESPTRGARANLLRVADRGVISVAQGLPLDQRRWAIAHELGHFETYAAVSYLSVCIGEDLRLSYDTSGHEQEANAFAAELLMPEDLFAPKCDIPKVSWTPIVRLAEEFRVSLSAATLRFLGFTWDRVAVVMSKDGKVVWSQATRDFGRRLAKGAPVDQWSLTYDFFKKGQASRIPETVSAEAWVPDARSGTELLEHVFPMPGIGCALTLLWWPPS